MQRVVEESEEVAGMYTRGPRLSAPPWLCNVDFFNTGRRALYRIHKSWRSAHDQIPADLFASTDTELHSCGFQLRGRHIGLDTLVF